VVGLILIPFVSSGWLFYLGNFLSMTIFIPGDPQGLG